MKFFILILMFCSFIAPALSHAEVSIQKVKDKKLLVSSDFEDLTEGEIFYVIDTNSTKKGVAKIIKVKGDRAIAILGKGTADIGDFLSKRAKVRKTVKRTVKKPTKKVRKSAPVADEFDPDDYDSDYDSDQKVYKNRKKKRKTYTTHNGHYLGAMVGFSNYTLDSQITSTQVANMTGSGFSLKAFYDRPLISWLNLRVEAGYESLSVANESQTFCGINQACFANLASLAADVWGRVHFLKSLDKFKPWIGGGLYALFPLSDDTNALDKESLGLSSSFQIGGGIDWHISPGKMIPIQIQYSLLPSADSADGNFISLKVGYGFSFK